jgi:hypothetical protein
MRQVLSCAFGGCPPDGLVRHAHRTPPTALSANSVVRLACGRGLFGADAPRTHMQVSDLRLFFPRFCRLSKAAGRGRGASSPSRTRAYAHAPRSGCRRPHRLAAHCECVGRLLGFGLRDPCSDSGGVGPASRAARYWASLRSHSVILRAVSLSSPARAVSCCRARPSPAVCWPGGAGRTLGPASCLPSR